MPPDPLGGMQSGYARQYTVDDAFIVYLAGHLVNQMHFPFGYKTGFGRFNAVAQRLRFF